MIEVNFDHLDVFFRRQSAALNLAANLNTRSGHPEIDGVKADHPAAAVEFDLVADLAPENIRVGGVDFDPDGNTAWPNSRIETAMGLARCHEV
jgi:hypothetical protein